MKETASCTAEEKRSLGVWPWKPNQRETAEKLRFLGSVFGGPNGGNEQARGREHKKSSGADSHTEASTRVKWPPPMHDP
jgi:truncated hemoglobin YjbI